MNRAAWDGPGGQVPASRLAPVGRASCGGAIRRVGFNRNGPLPDGPSGPAQMPSQGGAP